MDDSSVDGLSMDLAWDIVDKYKSAILAARERDLEQEAIALSRLGVVYSKLMKQKDQAYSNFHRSVTAALSLSPRTFDREPWFIEAQAAVKAHQMARQRREQEEEMANEAELRAEVMELLNKVSAKASSGTVPLLRFLYSDSATKPKNASHTLGSVGANDLKRTLTKALLHYNPSKQKAPAEGASDEDLHAFKLWKVTCKYIVVELTEKYNLIKGV